MPFFKAAFRNYMKMPLNGPDHMKGTAFYVLHKNTLFVSVDVFEKGLDVGKIVSLKDLANIEEKLGLGDEDVDPDDIDFEEEDVLDDVDAKKYNLEAIKNDLKK